MRRRSRCPQRMISDPPKRRRESQPLRVRRERNLLHQNTSAAKNGERDRRVWAIGGRYGPVKAPPSNDGTTAGVGDVIAGRI